MANGIIAGDFNHEWADTSGWYQTDLDREYTWSPKPPPNEPCVYKKIDHILAVDKPQTIDGGARSKGGSNHRLVVASIVFSTEAESVPNPWKNEPVQKKPRIKGSGTKKNLKKKIAAPKKAVTKKSTTKKNLLRKIR